MTAPRIPKISQPVIQSHIPRKKAYDSLDKLWDRPVIWISAPAGSGKTTLVASYLQLRATPCLWYQLDEHDSCLATFFHYLQLVLRHACDADHPALDSDRKNLWAFETSAWKDFAQYLTALPKIIDKIYTEHSSWAEEKKKQEKILIQGQTGAQSAAHQGRISESAGSRLKCLVLDNYHELPEDSPLHGFLATALHCLPADLKLIIISRHPPGAQFARLRANRLLALLGWTELKFSLQETRALISLVLQSAQHKNQTKGPDFQKNGQQQDPADQEIIAGVAHDITQGWAAGLVLLAEGLNSGHIQLASWGKLELPREILQYFDQEVCSRIDTRGLDLLLKTSFLTWMTPEMAQTLSGEQQAGAILEDLHRKNCFTDKCIQDTVYYQYHLLFRDFLQHKAKHVLSCAQISQLQQQTALVLAGRGYLQEAVELLFRAVNYEAAAQIVLDQAQDMLQQGLCNSLEVWLKQLPRELYAKYPWLHYWSGMCWQLVQPEQALLSFQQAFDAFVQVRDYAGALLSWSGAVDSILVGGDNFRQLDSWVQWLNNHLAQNQMPADREVQFRVAASMTGAILSRQSSSHQQQFWLDRAQKTIPSAKGAQDIFHICRLIKYCLHLGHYLQAGLLLKRTAPFVQDCSAALSRINWLLIQAVYANLAEGDGQKAISRAEEGLSLALDKDLHVFDLELLAQQAQGALNIYNLPGARLYLQRMAGVLQENQPVYTGHYHFLCAWQQYAADNYQHSSEHLRLALDLSLETGCRFSLTMQHIALAQILVHMHYPDQATQHMLRARSTGACHSGPLQFMYLLAQSMIFMHTKQQADADSNLESAFNLGSRQGYLQTAFWKRDMMSILCSRAIELNLQTAYARDLISHRNLSPGLSRDSYIWADAWPYPLRIFTLGRFEIELNGQPLSSAGKVPKKPLELLKSLIAFGSQEVPLDKIADALYPESDGDRAYHACKYTLHKLRTLLAQQDLLLLRGRKLSLDLRYCFVDLQNFIKLCTRIESLHKTSVQRPASKEFQLQQTLQILELCRRALNLYQGSFLDNDEAQWAEAVRERLRKKFVNLVLITGSCLEFCGQKLEAISIYEQSIILEELQESIYQRLMLGYHTLGQPGEAMAVYKRCRKTLNSRLGIEPAPETRAALHALNSGNTSHKK